ncbi:PREDICTED: homocysteine S-methyltransferase-like [Dinoponera quadriceps]|uniref:Homocysteine S-methyltransferase-like n=1 Tax=Dinoponera quadriceps TaxID=609295 RepID=A0A6P3WY64_DINQU|nr:PREDICTED: homocysteine S-methyltransferase-like [Dinoponera quadriceps]
MDKPTVLDGDFETELRRHFPDADQYGTLFALRAFTINSKALHNTHMAYLRAGARIIRTNTYRIIPDVMQLLQLDSIEYMSLIYLAVIAANTAVKMYAIEMGYDLNSEEYKRNRPLVAGSCGSCLFSLVHNMRDKWNIPVEVLHRLSQTEIIQFHKTRVMKLLRAGVDLLTFESIPTMNELRAIFTLLKSYKTARVLISLLCSDDGRLMDGHDFRDVVRRIRYLLPCQLFTIGAECRRPETMITIMESINSHGRAKIPFLLYIDKSHTLENTGASSAAPSQSHVQELIARGIRYIAGGIETNAMDTRVICTYVDSFCRPTCQDDVSSGEASTSFKPSSYQNIKTLSKL